MPLSKNRVRFDNMNISETLAYIAGFFDGEGSICFRTNRTSRPSPMISAIQKHSEVLEKISEFFSRTYGVSFCAYQDNDGFSRIESTKRDTTFLICSLLHPYLVVKKEQAAYIIEFINLRRNEGFLGKTNIDREMEIATTVKMLNGGRFL